MILDRLRTMSDLTASEQALADLIAERPTFIINSTIAEVARESATSNATIVRFCRKLGFDGFRSFRLQLVAEMEHAEDAGIAVDPDFPITPRQSTTEMLASIADLTKEAVDACHAALRPADVQHVARLIAQADAVFFFATGDSQISCEAFANLLLKLGVRCIIAGSQGEYRAVAHTVRRHDLAIFASYSGDFLDTPALNDVLPTLKERGCETVLVTSAALRSPWIDQYLVFPARESVQGKMATFYSQTCIRYLFNCLYAAVWSMDYHENLARKYRIDGTSPKSA